MTDKSKKEKKKKKFDIREVHRNKKPSHKIIDIIGDIIKLPYTIRGGEAKGGRIGFAHGSKRPKGGWKD